MKNYLHLAAAAAAYLVPSAASAQSIPAAVIAVVDLDKVTAQCNACKTAATALRSQFQGLQSREKALATPLETEAKSIQAAVDALGIQATVDPKAGRAMEKLPEGVKSRAMGGGFGATPALLGNILAPDLTFGVLSDLLGTMASRLDIMRTGVQRRQALAAATPSIWPVTGGLTSRYGNRRDPFTGGPDFHPGLDISAEYGEPVRATADGVVVVAERSGAYGNLVEIDHGYGIVTRYGHLSRFRAVNGQQIHRGDVIGYVGSTGRSTSAHLHYEILLNGKLTDPMKLLAQ